MRLLVARTAEERDAARRIEAQVFLQAFGNTAELMEQEYGPFEARSRFVVVIDDVSGAALGTARLITAGSSPVKTLVDVAGDPWHLPMADSLGAAGLVPGTVWDVASLAVDPRYRAGASGAEVSLALCHGLWRHAAHCGVPGLVTILDDRVLRLVRSMGLSWPAMAGASSEPYLGSPASTPCVLDVPTAGDDVWAARPDLAPAMVDGRFRSIALDPADLLPVCDTDVQPDVPTVRPEPSLPPRRDTTGWRPPTSRRGELVPPPGA